MIAKSGKHNWMMIYLAPVLTLWAGVVAETLGFDSDETLTLRRAIEQRSTSFL
jgi:hypothetical protein